ncbi:MAG: hypothetical protein QF751_02890 [Alphaproteobacteria bacterium]|nr:hypothetical protein [Alphaproteobacteria bacterium]
MAQNTNPTPRIAPRVFSNENSSSVSAKPPSLAQAETIDKPPIKVKITSIFLIYHHAYELIHPHFPKMASHGLILP